MLRNKPDKPLDKQVSEFVRFHLWDNGAFAPFTGTDFDAWRAYIHLVRLWGRTRGESVVAALRAVVHTAQIRNNDVMAVFKKSIPCLLDWSDEPSLWKQIGPRVELRDVDHDLAACLNAKAERVMWPCSDGRRVCSHINSKPSKKHPGWFVCKDPTCRDEWRPDDAAEASP